MALMRKPERMRWPHSYWVQPGEVAVLVDGGNTADSEGTPNVFRAGDTIRARFRLFRRGRKQEIVVFDAKRQPEPVSLVDEVFLLTPSGLSVTLSVDIYYRISDPLPLLERVHLEDRDQIDRAIRGRVRHIIERLVQQRPLGFFLGIQEAVRDALLNNLWLAENDLIIEDAVIHHLRPPEEVAQAHGALVARLSRHTDLIRSYLDAGVDPSFNWVQRNEPKLARRIVAAAAGSFGWLPPQVVRGGSDEVAVLARTAWDELVATIAKHLDEDEQDEEPPVEVMQPATGYPRPLLQPLDVSVHPSVSREQDGLPRTGSAVAQDEVPTTVPPEASQAPEAAANTEVARLTAPPVTPPGSEQEIPPVPAPNKSASREPLTSVPASVMQADSQAVLDEEVSRLIAAGYFVQRPGRGTIAAMDGAHRITFQCPPDFPQRAPEVTVESNHGSAQRIEVPWEPGGHLAEAMQRLVAHRDPDDGPASAGPSSGEGAP